MKYKKVLLTGASGFVGKKILKYLLKHKYSIKAVVRDLRIKEQAEFEQVEFIYTEDIFKEELSWWEEQISDVDIIVHAAWYSEPGRYLDSLENLNCLKGTLNLAQAVKYSNVKRFVGLGTCFEYDLTADMPLSVKSSLDPKTIYAATKVSAFYNLRELFDESNLNFSWCRLFYMFGDGEDERKLTSYLRSRLSKNLEVELTSGEQIRDFMDVDKVGNSIVQLISLDHSGPINICSGIPISVKDFCLKIAKKEGKEHLLKFGSRKENKFDPEAVYGLKSSYFPD